ncbi:exosortase F system-associated membrane protein [Croceiramulus getboli]|nr:exosortase F system-associated protein [Flavobacteriaceae bacterium YJPT1-3]
MKTSFRILVIVLLFILLAFIRFRESVLFYDPLTEFFKGNFLNQALPEINYPKFLLHLFFRFTINSLISLLILWVAFEERGIITFAALLYGILFVLLFSVFVVLLQTSEQEFMSLFYVRRFLIHPLFILLLLPAFYYYKRQSK